MEKQNVDFITGMNNMKHLADNYHNYVSANKSYLIEVDLTKFKNLNDNYGHEKGDDCLKILSSTLRKVFTNSLTIRRGGDEFVVVTSKNIKDIERRLNIVKEAITRAYEVGQIPLNFNFNCGIVEANDNLEETLEKADVMMYSAKKSNELIRIYDDEIYEKFKIQEQFLNDIDKSIKKEELEISSRPIENLNSEKVMDEIYSVDTNGISVFNPDNYELLRQKYKIKVIDVYNLLKIATTESLVNKKIMVNLHNQTLFSNNKSFEDQIEDYLYINEMNPYDITLNINVEKLNCTIPEIITKLQIVKQLGFKLGLDKYNYNSSGIITNIWEDVSIDYIKIDKNLLDNAKCNKKIESHLEKFIQLINEYDTEAIFSKLGKEDYEFIDNLNVNKNKILVKERKDLSKILTK